MDRQLGYQSIVKDFLRGWQEYTSRSNEDDSEMLVSFDDEHSIYFLMDLGWGSRGRIRDLIFLLRIVDGKVWIEENRTDQNIGIELMEMGIPRDHIVLGLHSPRKRQYTDYAAA